MSIDNDLFNATDFTPETADPAELLAGDASERMQARREAIQRDRETAQTEHTASVEGFLEEPKRSRTAKQYENKAADMLRFAMRMTVTSDKTVADAAALLTYGETVAEKLGDLAAEDARVAKIIDFVNGGTESPYLNLAMAVMPLALQIMRNHESDAVADVTRTFKLFGRWEIKIPFKIRLRNKFARSLTTHPKQLYDATFVPEVREALKAQGIDVPAYKG